MQSVEGAYCEQALPRGISGEWIVAFLTVAERLALSWKARAQEMRLIDLARAGLYLQQLLRVRPLSFVPPSCLTSSLFVCAGVYRGGGFRSAFLERNEAALRPTGTAVEFCSAAGAAVGRGTR